MRWILVPMVVAVALWSGCGGGRPEAAVPPARPAVPAQTARVILRQEPGVYEATGTVRARTATAITSRVVAYVRQVDVEVGDRVREGQLLVLLDAQDLDANVRRAQAAAAEVLSAIPEADNAVLGAKASLDLAQSTFRRMEELASKKSISNQEFDEASARLTAAQAGYEMARAKRAQLDSKRAEMQEEIGSASILRGYARIAAPFSGIVTAKSVEPGTLAAPNAPLLTLERDGGYRLEAAVDESRIAFVKPAQSVDVDLDSLGRRFAARVSEIVPAVDAASRSYIVKIDLPAVPDLRSGLFGRARFAVTPRQIIAIPLAAMMERGQLQSVFVVEEGIARRRLVTAGPRGTNDVEVLSGLSEGEEVVSPVPPDLADGSRVAVRQ